MSRSQSRLSLEISRARGPMAWLLVVIFFGVVSAIIICNNLTGVSLFGTPYKVQLAVDDAQGITPGTQEVELNGVQVGTVSSERLSGTTPILTLSINSKYAPLYRNAQFQIRPNTPLEDLFVDIVNRGTPSAGRLTSGDVVNEDQTQTPVEIANVLDVFEPNVRQELGVALDELAKGTPDNGLHLDEAFEQLVPFLQVANRTMHVVAERNKLVAQASTNFANVIAAIGDRDQQLEGLVRYGDGTLAELARENQPFNAVLADLPSTMTDLQSAFSTLRGTETQLDPALSDLQPVADHLGSALTSLRSLARSANPALNALQPALVKLHPLATQLRPTAQQLSSAVNALEPQTPAFNHITSQVVGCESSLSGFFNNTISVFKYYDGYGAFPRGNLTFDDTAATGTSTANLTQYTPCTGPLS